MSLISQNVVPKKQRRLKEGQAADGSPVDKETLLADEHKLNSSKRSYDLLEGRREQEKEMKKLESLKLVEKRRRRLGMCLRSLWISPPAMIEWARIDPNSTNIVGASDDESGVTVAHGYENMEGDDVLRSNDELVVKGGDKLLPGLLEYSRVMNANSEEPSNGPINSVQFHRNGQLLLTAVDRTEGLGFSRLMENTTPRYRAYALRTARYIRLLFCLMGLRS